MPFFVATGPAEQSNQPSITMVTMQHEEYSSRPEAEAAAPTLRGHRTVVVEADDIQKAMALAHVELTGKPYPEIPDHVRRAAQDAQQDDEGTELA